ncbi:MAG: prepilin-type N-terminal cleavage/methylation domain-containing protein [Hyphomicrobiaceae bacterium]|nr:prepilin-type N-terminal cleavage/methylation domain-containing protein [Hyphomicrobiaceae bacterium]
MKRHSLRGDEGFTLLEVLVSLALLSLMAAAMASALSDARKASLWAERKSTDAAIGSVRLLLSRLISEARPLKLSKEDGSLIDGEPDRLRFITNVSAAGSVGGLNETVIFLETDARGKKSLAISQVLFRQSDHASLVERQPMQLSLQENAVDLSFRYFGRADLDARPRWHTQWHHSGRLPSLIEIELILPNNDPRSWPPLLVQLGLAER